MQGMASYFPAPRANVGRSALPAWSTCSIPGPPPPPPTARKVVASELVPPIANSKPQTNSVDPRYWNAKASAPPTPKRTLVPIACSPSLPSSRISGRQSRLFESRAEGPQKRAAPPPPPVKFLEARPAPRVLSLTIPAHASMKKVNKMVTIPSIASPANHRPSGPTYFAPPKVTREPTSGPSTLANGKLETRPPRETFNRRQVHDSKENFRATPSSDPAAATPKEGDSLNLTAGSSENTQRSDTTSGTKRNNDGPENDTVTSKKEHIVRLAATTRNRGKPALRSVKDRVNSREMETVAGEESSEAIIAATRKVICPNAGNITEELCHSFVISRTSNADASAIGRRVDVVQIHRNPQICFIPKLLTTEECNDLVNRAESNFYGGWQERKSNPNALIGFSFKSIAIERSADDFVSMLERRLAVLAEVPVADLGRLTILKFEEGDQFEPRTELAKVKATLTVFLNDLPDGGEIDFVEMGFQIRPQAGNAVLWREDKKIKRADLAPLGEPKYILGILVPC